MAVFDGKGQPMPDRRKHGRREGDELRDDALDPAILLGYEQWAGRVWKHRAKVLFAFSLLTGAGGCVVGYLGRRHDLDSVKDRITADSSRTERRLDRVEAIQDEQRRLEPVKMLMLCSLVRRVDPNGVPVECSQPQNLHP